MEHPIFILAAGWRTGSTLLQRLLNSHDDILIWGENNGLVGSLERVRESIELVQVHASKQLANYRKHGSTAWVAVMNPPISEFDAGLRQLFETYYRNPARELGKNRWGFKEVRHSVSSAVFLWKLYPAARFLFLLRHPEDCLASARSTRIPPLREGIIAEVGGPREFLETWVRIASSFVDPGDIPHMTLHYEELVVDPAATAGRIAEFLGIAGVCLDLTVFETRRRGWLGLPPRLTDSDRSWLKSDWLWQAAEKHGYHPRR